MKDITNTVKMRPFTRSDYYTYSGAEPVKVRHPTREGAMTVEVTLGPWISEPLHGQHDATLIISKDGVHAYYNNDGDDIYMIKKVDYKTVNGANFWITELDLLERPVNPSDLLAMGFELVHPEFEEAYHFFKTKFGFHIPRKYHPKSKNRRTMNHGKKEATLEQVRIAMQRGTLF